MTIEEDNIKLRDAIFYQRASNIVKEIKKVYDDRYSKIADVLTAAN